MYDKLWLCYETFFVDNFLPLTQFSKRKLLQSRETKKRTRKNIIHVSAFEEKKNTHPH